MPGEVLTTSTTLWLKEHAMMRSLFHVLLLTSSLAATQWRRRDSLRSQGRSRSQER